MHHDDGSHGEDVDVGGDGGHGEDGDEHREEGKGKAEWKEDQKLNLCFPSSECSNNKIIPFFSFFFKSPLWVACAQSNGPSVVSFQEYTQKSGNDTLLGVLLNWIKLN